MAGFEKEHKQFWRQVILWLAKKEDTEKAGVWIKLAQRQYTPGRPIEFSVGAMSPQGEPIADATFEASAVLPDGNHRPVHLARQGNQTIGQFKQTELPGDYTLSVTATSAGAAVGEAHARFIVYDQDLELENSTPRPTLMANLAQTTKAVGGRTLVPEDLSKLCQELRRQPRDLEVAVETKQTPWDSPYYFLLVVALLSGRVVFAEEMGAGVTSVEPDAIGRFGRRESDVMPPMRLTPQALRRCETASEIRAADARRRATVTPAAGSVISVSWASWAVIWRLAW